MKKLFLLISISIMWACSFNAIESESFNPPGNPPIPSEGSVTVLSPGDTTLLPDSVQIGLILMGQSNMVGDNTGQFPPTYLTTPMPGVYIRDKFFNWSTLDYPINNNGNNFGPELSLCYHLADTLQRDLYVVKPAFDGAGLYADHLKNDFNINTHELYDKPNWGYSLKEAGQALVNKITSLGKTPLIIMVVVQGERDTKNATVAAQYNANFTAIINQLSIDSVQVDYVVMNLLSTNQTTLNATNRSTVNNQKLAYASAHSNVFIFDTTPYPLNVDNTHFSGPGQVQIGKDICDIIYDQIIDP